MSKLEELLQKHKNVIAKRELVIARQKALEKEIAAEACPYKIGDRLITNKGVEASVSSIYFYAWDDYWKIKVRKIKKNGKLFALEHDVWNIKNWKKVKR